MGSEYDSHTSVLSSYPGSVTFFLNFFYLFIISFFANELFMWPIYRPVACNELTLAAHAQRRVIVVGRFNLSLSFSVCPHFFSRTVVAVDTKRGYVGMCNGRSAQQESGAALSKDSMFTAGGLKLYTAIILGVH